VDRRVGEDGST